MKLSAFPYALKLCAGDRGWSCDIDDVSWTDSYKPKDIELARGLVSFIAEHFKVSSLKLERRDRMLFLRGFSSGMTVFSSTIFINRSNSSHRFAVKTIKLPMEWDDPIFTAADKQKVSSYYQSLAGFSKLEFSEYEKHTIGSLVTDILASKFNHFLENDEYSFLYNMTSFHDFIVINEKKPSAKSKPVQESAQLTYVPVSSLFNGKPLKALSCQKINDYLKVKTNYGSLIITSALTVKNNKFCIQLDSFLEA